MPHCHDHPRRQETDRGQDTGPNHPPDETTDRGQDTGPKTLPDETSDRGQDTGPNHPRRQETDRGQVAPLAALFVLVLTLAVVAVAMLGERAVELSRAQTAADAVALAAAASDADSAAGVANAVGAANGASSTAVTRGRDGTALFATSVVTVGDVTGQARALGLETQGTSGLAPALVAALARAEQLLGEPVPVVSGWRSPAEQQALWDNRANNPFPVAPPGSSLHEQGLAVDVPQTFVATLLTVAPAVGLCQPLPVTDPIHFVLCAAG